VLRDGCCAKWRPSGLRTTSQDPKPNCPGRRASRMETRTYPPATRKSQSWLGATLRRTPSRSSFHGPVPANRQGSNCRQTGGVQYRWSIREAQRSLCVCQANLCRLRTERTGMQADGAQFHLGREIGEIIETRRGGKNHNSPFPKRRGLRDVVALKLGRGMGYKFVSGPRGNTIEPRAFPGSDKLHRGWLAMNRHR